MSVSKQCLRLVTLTRFSVQSFLFNGLYDAKRRLQTIGASADGLVQHVHPTHASALLEILSWINTKIAILLATENLTYR